MRTRKVISFVAAMIVLFAAWGVGIDGFGRVLAAGGLDWSGATAGSLGQYMAADAVPAGSLLVGKTPAVGTTDTLWEVKSGGPTADKLTDGAFCTNNSTGRVIYELRRQDYNSGSWAPFTFALDESVKIGYFLIGSETGSAQYLTDVRVYVSEELDTLYEDANKVAEATGVSLGNYFIRGKATIGRYVGFAFRNPCGYWSAPWYGEIRFGELAAYSMPLGPDWEEASAGTQGWYTKATELEPNSLIAGLTPTKGVSGDAWTTYNSQLSWITDGNLVLAGNSNRVQIDLNPSVPSGQWAQLTFDVGYTNTFTHFCIGSEANAAQYLTKAKIYVSETLADLYSDSHLVVDVSDVSLGNYYVKGEAAVGKYVGFAFQNPGGFWSAPWYGLLRIGELAAYGQELVQEVLTNRGAQLRNPDASDAYALRFAFDVTGAGIVYADADPTVNGNYARDLTNARIRVDGEWHTLVDMGAVLTNRNSFGDTLTREDVDNYYTLDVTAQNLFAVEDGSATFTAVVMRIPAGKADVTIYAVPYVEYETAAGTAVLYGTMISRSVNDVLHAVE